MRDWVKNLKVCTVAEAQTKLIELQKGNNNEQRKAD